MKKPSLRSVIFRLFVLIITIVFVVVGSFVKFNIKDDIEQIYSVFIGKKSQYVGIIEVWNIDTFESGVKPKSSYIENIAKKFQQKNKGVYVMVRNLTVGECENLLKENVLPDIFSCSYGVAEMVKDYIRPFEKESDHLCNNFLDAGKGVDGKLYALAWCVGFYSLISTRSKLEKTGKNFENVKLNEIALSSDYSYRVGKNEKISKSLVYGESLYLMPKNALDAYNKARSIQIDENEENQIRLKSQYSAYSAFLANDASILLGTHRDVFKMIKREESGSVSDVVYLPLTNWTDLVQYSLLCENKDEKRRKVAEEFAVFLTEKENQMKLEDIGMFSVCDAEMLNLKGVMRDITPEIISGFELNGII